MVQQQDLVQFGSFGTVRMLTATEVDYPDSEAHLTEILRSFNFKGIVIALSRINLLLQRSEDPFACEKTLQTNFCSDVLRNEIEARRLTNHIIFHREATLRLLSRSVCVADPNSKRLPDTTHEARHELTRCYLIANKLLATESPDTGEESTASQRKDLPEMFSHFEYAVNNSPGHHIRNTIVRSDDFLRRLQRKSQKFDLNRTFSQATKLTIKDYQHLIFSILAKVLSFSPKKIRTGEAYIFGTNVSPTLNPLYDKLLQHICISIDEIANRSNSTPSLTNQFLLWRKYPLLKISENHIMCVDMGFLVDKIETGVFWIIRQLLEDNEPGKGEEIIALRGEVFEDYAASIVERGIHAQSPSRMERCIIKPKYAQKEQAECTDIAVYGSDTLILLECKAPLLAAQTKFSGDSSSFYKNLEAKLIEPKGIKQLWDAIQILAHEDETKRYIVEGIDISKVKKIFPVLVLPDRLFSLVFMNRFLDSAFQQFVKCDDVRKDMAIMPLTVLTIADLEDLEPYLSDKPFHAHLNEWITQVFESNKSFPFSQYLRSLMETELRQNSHMGQEAERIHSDRLEYFSLHGLN